MRQVLKPRTAKEHRPLSDNLRSAIHAAVRERLHDDPDEIPAVIAEIDAEFKDLASQMTYRDLANTDTTFSRMLNASEAAHEQVIFTFQPAEAVENDPSAERLRKELLERIGLVPSEEKATERKCKYRFFVDREFAARMIWKTIFDAASTALGKSIADSRLEAIDVEEQLTIHVVDIRYCVFPCVVFDPNTAKSTGFVLFYEASSENQERATGGTVEEKTERVLVSIAQMNPEAIALWKRSIYETVTNPSLTDSKYTRVRWIDVRDMYFRERGSK